MDSLNNAKYYVGLFLAVVVAVVLVRAEKNQNWLAAEASLATILLLLALLFGVWWKANYKAPQLSPEADVYYRATNKVLVWVGVGFAALVLSANRWDHWKYGLVAKAIGYLVVIAGAFFIAGALLGYLFGLRPTGASQNQASGAAVPPPPTNLEEIADWLTKLILGAGLVELTRLKGPISDFAAFMAHGLDPAPFLVQDYLLKHPNENPNPGSPAIALAIMSFFSASGLLYGYLWTRYQQALRDFPPPPNVTSPPAVTSP